VRRLVSADGTDGVDDVGGGSGARWAGGPGSGDELAIGMDGDTGIYAEK
jgi:hypothetical protein